MAKNQGITNRTSPCEAGSVLIWILVAVALFGALSFTLNKGQRAGVASVSKEQAALAMSEMLDYARAIRGAVQELQINGCADTEISFEETAMSGYTNTNAPTDESCHVFRPNGGGLRPVSFTKSLVDQSKTEGWTTFYIGNKDSVQGAGTDCAQDSCVDMVATLWGIPTQTCLSINEKLGITNPGGNLPEDDLEGEPPFQGSYSYDAAFIVGDTTPELSGKSAGCFKYMAGGADPACFDNGAPCNVFYQVLIAR